MTKYRENILKNVTECPGMCSDRPGITPNDLDLERSPHVLERERGMEKGVDVVGFGGTKKGTHHIN